MSIKNIKCKNYNSFLHHLIIHARFLTYNNKSVFIKPTTIYNNEILTYNIIYKKFKLITNINQKTFNIYYKNQLITTLKNINGYYYINIKFLVENIKRLLTNIKGYMADCETIYEIFEIPETMPTTTGDFITLQSFIIKTINNFYKCHINMGLNVDEIIYFDQLFTLLTKHTPLNSVIIPVYNILNTPLEKCPITLENTTQTAQLKICGHLFSVIGLTNWLKVKNTCPLCRAEIPNYNA